MEIPKETQTLTPHPPWICIAWDKLDRTVKKCWFMLTIDYRKHRNQFPSCVDFIFLQWLFPQAAIHRTPVRNTTLNRNFGSSFLAIRSTKIFLINDLRRP